MAAGAQKVFDPGELLSQFVPDTPKPAARHLTQDRLAGRIAGCSAMELAPASDQRGDLFELLTLRDEGTEPIVHIYQVRCAPGSIRAWIYHSKQSDRLCYTEGSFRIVLYDLRVDSPTAGTLVSFHAGVDAPTLLTIPAFVVHGVQNLGDEPASFVNMPTNVYHHQSPDKFRLPYDSPLIPFTW
jgi:dTDP-4-dehydrorhamnose 3,5-epimerase